MLTWVWGRRTWGEHFVNMTFGVKGLGGVHFVNMTFGIKGLEAILATAICSDQVLGSTFRRTGLQVRIDG